MRDESGGGKLGSSTRRTEREATLRVGNTKATGQEWKPVEPQYLNVDKCGEPADRW